MQRRTNAMVFTKMGHSVFCLAATILTACTLPSGGETAPAKQVQSTVSQRVHPLLIRNDHNALVQVRVDDQDR